MTRSPNALWIAQQLREAWPYVPAHRFLLFDRDSKFGTDVISAVRDLGIQPIRTAFRSPVPESKASHELTMRLRFRPGLNRMDRDWSWQSGVLFILTVGERLKWLEFWFRVSHRNGLCAEAIRVSACP